MRYTFPAFDLLVEDDPVEAFSSFQELLRQVEMGSRDKAEAVEVPLHPDLGIFDALGNFDLLLTGQQRHLPHLLEVHPHRIIEDIQPARGVALFLVGFLLLLLVLLAFLLGSASCSFFRSL